METPRMNPYVALLAGVISISSAAILVRLSSAPSGVIAFYRMFISVLVLLPIFLRKHRFELKLITRKDWWFTMISGILLAFHFIFWLESLKFTSVASSTVLVTLQPLFSFAGTYIFFHEKLSGKAILSGVLAVIGSVMISCGDFRISGSALLGDFLALISCALITSYLLLGQNVRKRLSLVTYTFVLYSISTLILLIYALFAGQPLFPYPSQDWAYFILLALIPNLLGQTLFNWLLKWLSTSVITVATLFEPVGATILAYLFLGEKTVWTQNVGGLIVIAGISLFALNINERRQLKMGRMFKYYIAIIL